MSIKRIFKTKHFARWMKKSGLSDRALYKAVIEMENGLIDADLGGGVLKKRIGFQGRGKSGGVRTLIATNKNNRWFFMYGFAKNEKDNISKTELGALQAMAEDLLLLPNVELNDAVREDKLHEVNND